MRKTLINLSRILFLLLIANVAFSALEKKTTDRHSLYIGMLNGFASTDWSQIACPNCADTDFILVSLPKTADDTGYAWGAFLGYQINRSFALELTYTHYPVTTLHFVIPNDYNTATIKSNTSTYSFVGKFLVPIYSSPISAFASAGLVAIDRTDQIADVVRVGAAFGLGLFADITPRIIGEFGFQFDTGYGKAEIDEVNDYVPFIYIIYAKLGYRLNL